MSSTEKSGIVLAGATLAKAAVEMATLVSALPQNDRMKARMELVYQVERCLRYEGADRSLYPQDSVIRHEIARIADGLARVFDSALPHQQGTLWGDFNVAFSNRLALIEFTADSVVAQSFE